MRIAIYIISALLTNYVFSFATTLLITAGFDKMGSDPGSPGILLFSLMCICGIFSIVTVTIMEIGKAKYRKEFSAKFSALIFLFTYFPTHIIGLFIPDIQLGFLSAPIGILLAIMLFFSYIPLFHMTAQGLVNLNEFVKRQELAGNRYPKYFVPAFLVVIVLFIGWLMSKPAIPPSPNVLSLQDHWELLESSGRDWQSDAYLNEIVFDVNEIFLYKISASYLSKSMPDERYSIDINEKGEIYNKETSEIYPMRESAKLPIKREDWAIGSTQAWDLYLKDKTISAHATSREKYVPMYMRLDRTVSGRLAWELVVVDCPDECVRYSFYLDAKTGETIDSYLQ
jgi:hypothetical protein